MSEKPIEDNFVIFEWDENKELKNINKHKVSFQEAKTVFNDPYSITIYDPQHSAMEDRYIDIGLSAQGRLLVVVYTERENIFRIITSRIATEKERQIYEHDRLR